MDVSIALFWLEMLRAGVGEAVRGVEAARAALLQPSDEDLAATEAQAAAEAPSQAARTGLPATRFLVGALPVQEPIGPGPIAASPGSIAFGESDDELPAFLEELAAAGVRVAPGSIGGSQGAPGGDALGGDGGTSGAASTGAVTTPPLRYRLREYTLFPPTPYIEPFSLIVPSPLPKGPRPLLVVFHKYGASHLDAVKNTDFVRECAARGWFLVCPLGGSKKHFSSIESQTNTEAVLDWVLGHASLRIDRARIYGVGFSMGGGALLNYAARHRDPSHAMFAAIVNHTGNSSLNDTYRRDPPTRFIFDFWYGDGSTGSADAWKMTRSSVIDFNSATLAVDEDADLARNLGSTPLATWRAEFDTIPYLPQQNDLLDQHLQTKLGRVPGPTYGYTVVPYTGHDWRMLDATAACDWLAQFTLAVPTSGRTLADVDATYDHFFVEQEVAGAFTPFDWSIDAANNSLSITGTANLARLTVDSLTAGLAPTTDLLLQTSSADGTSDDIVIARWNSHPSAVTRDGVAITSWQYDSVSRRLTLRGNDGAPHAWKVTP